MLRKDLPDHMYRLGQPGQRVKTRKAGRAGLICAALTPAYRLAEAILWRNQGIPARL